jgi:hypothetical protein
MNVRLLHEGQLPLFLMRTELASRVFDLFGIRREQRRSVGWCLHFADTIAIGLTSLLPHPPSTASTGWPYCGFALRRDPLSLLKRQGERLDHEPAIAKPLPRHA